MKIGFFSYFVEVMKDKLLRTSVIAFLILAYTLVRPEAQGLQPGLDQALRSDPPFLEAGAAWADSVMASLTLDERIAQMIMVYGYSNMGPAHENAVLKQVKRQKVGGILFFQGEPLEQARLTYLLGGERTTVQSGRPALFWATTPHPIVEYENVSSYTVMTLAC